MNLAFDFNESFNESLSLGNDSIHTNLLADILSMSKNTINKWELNGKINPITTDTGERHYLIKDLLSFKIIAEMFYSSWDEENLIQPIKSFSSIELFSGAGGLALGLEQAGFNAVLLNEVDKHACNTLRHNRPHWNILESDITQINFKPYVGVDFISGGFPCQSFSFAGKQLGFEDARGTLFFEFARAVQEIQPKFFLAENVSGMLLEKHDSALNNIKLMFREAGYNLAFKMLNCADFGIPQDRKRVFFIGYHLDLGIEFDFPQPTHLDEHSKITLKQTIGDLEHTSLPSKQGNILNREKLLIPNHEYMLGGFSSIYMSRNRIRSWNEVSFTIQAGARHAPCHPQAPKFQFVEPNVRIFVPNQEHLYRRLSVRECARVQTFPDDFHFYYNDISDGYKMIGNAVPVNMAYILANQIMNDLKCIQ